MDWALAVCTSGQFPASQVIAVDEPGVLLSGQYAAAEYCSKNESWFKRSCETAILVRPELISNIGCGEYLWTQLRGVEQQ